MLKLNTDNIYKTLKDFYTLTKIRIVLFDSEFRELMSYPQARYDFCAAIRDDPECCEKCVRSDQKGCQKCAETKALVIYECHAGLIEAVTPIFDKDGILGYVMFGQILPKETYEKSKKDLLKKFPEKRYHGISQKIEHLQVKSSAEIAAAATVLQALTAYLLTNRWVTPEKAKFIRQIDRYIEDHLSQSITMEQVCDAFRIGRTRLYELSVDYLGCGLSDYIRNQRICHAQQMLRQTDRPISEIACAVGFSDYNHFSRIFKQTVGMSARAYRSQTPDNREFP